MRWLALLLLALAACGEPAAVRVPPTDRFLYPSGLALAARADGGRALLVASANSDLLYDGATGGTLLSVDPAPAPAGSAGAAGGALVKLGEGARIGSYAGQLVLAEEATCPGFLDPITGGSRTALVPTGFDDALVRLPVGADGSVAPCAQASCALPLDSALRAPSAVALACRADGARRSAFVGYLQAANLDTHGLQGWITEVDLDSPTSASRTFPVGVGGPGAMAYDALTDRLYVAARPSALAAPVYVLDLSTCRAGSCTSLPTSRFYDLFTSLRGAELQAIAFSNPQAGLARRAYLTARVYDASLFALLGARPSADLSGALLVIDLAEDATGSPSFRVERIVPVGVGPGQLVVLPARVPVGGQPRRDVVVLATGSDGAVTVYDDDSGDVVRVIALDEETGAPQVGRTPYALVAEPLARASASGPAAWVYVAAYKEGLVTPIVVPLDAPGDAHPLRSGADGTTGTVVRIGGKL